MSNGFIQLVQTTKSAQVDASGLAQSLRASIQGDVRFDNGSRALYATDGSNYRQVPIGVVLPRDVDDVLAIVSLCREFGAPLLCRGGGTSLAGQCCNVAVILDFSKYMAGITEIDPARRIARVQPGVVLDHLRNAAEKYQLTFAPDPATHDRCTLGGMIGNNSCGVHSVMAVRWRVRSLDGKEPASPSSRRPVAWWKVLLSAYSWSWPIPISINAPITCRKSCRTSRSASKASMICSRITPGARESTQKGCRFYLKAVAGCWWNSAPTRYKRPSLKLADSCKP